MISNILVALDNSEFASKVMGQAVELAKVFGAKLTGISVVDHAVMTWVDDSGVTVMPEILDAVRQSFELRLERCEQAAEKAGINFEKVIMHGNPAHSIVDYATAHSVDLIVVGHIGRTGAERLLLGSVAHKVTNYARCSVFVVR